MRLLPPHAHHTTALVTGYATHVSGAAHHVLFSHGYAFCVPHRFGCYYVFPLLYRYVAGFGCALPIRHHTRFRLRCARSLVRSFTFY